MWGNQHKVNLLMLQYLLGLLALVLSVLCNAAIKIFLGIGNPVIELLDLRALVPV
jgi:hypothetical protein